MFIPSVRIDRDVFVTDLVKQDYRTAAVFRKYGIEFCCAGRWPLSIVCDNLRLDIEPILDELKAATRPLQFSATPSYQEWDVDFISDYIINVHHRYLRDRMPLIEDLLERFIDEHQKKYPELLQLKEYFHTLVTNIHPHLLHEEEVIFPYARQIAHAFTGSEPYASLLVRTLRKPVEDMMRREQDMVMALLVKMRQLTRNYSPPDSACISHKVSFSMLRELDNDLTQHLYLENVILFPKVLEMEKALLEKS